MSWVDIGEGPQRLRVSVLTIILSRTIAHGHTGSGSTPIQCTGGRACLVETAFVLRVYILSIAGD